MHNILAIESSCDETAVAIYNQQHGLLAHSLYSQILLHQDYGGVVPEIASREHLLKIGHLIKQALSSANINLNDIDAFAYTKGPGLAGALLIGSSVANSMAYACGKPTVAIHHLEGHILSPFLDTENMKKLKFPFLCLLVSGGHTQLILAKNLGEYEIIGDTLDDSAGEAFDKTAKLLGLGYPGGQIVSEYAINGEDIYNFPRPMKHSTDLDFSFAGLKTAVLTQVKKIQSNKQVQELYVQDKRNICKSFVNACVDVISHKCLKAINLLKQQGYLDINLIVCGGVSANKQLRQCLDNIAQNKGFKVYYPQLKWCTDNAAMIALAASMHMQRNKNCSAYNYIITVNPRWVLV